MFTYFFYVKLGNLPIQVMACFTLKSFLLVIFSWTLQWDGHCTGRVGDFSWYTLPKLNVEPQEWWFCIIPIYLSSISFPTHRIHGTGIFTYIDPIKINRSCRWIYQSHGFYGLYIYIYRLNNPFKITHDIGPRWDRRTSNYHETRRSDGF